VLHVAAPEPDFVGFDLPGGPYDAAIRAADLERLADELEAVAGVLRDQGVVAQGELVSGPTVATIVERSTAPDVAMIVIAGRRHNVVHRVMLGSVVSSVLKHTELPVVVVPPPAKPDTGRGFAAALDQLVEAAEREEAARADSTGDRALIDLRDAAEAQISDEATADTNSDGFAALKQAINNFETDHPGLIRAINDVSYYLSTQGV
jgi:nucleotide-binding universal stress UspA family protein